MTSDNLVSPEMLASWLVMLGLLMFVDRRHGRAPLFLVYAFIAGLAINHWFGALVHAVPWNPFTDSANTISGFQAATWGLLFFVLGAVAVPRLAPTRTPRQPATPASARARKRTGPRAANILLAVGVLSWILEVTPIASLPSMSAAVSAGKQMLIAGICLKCWIYWRNGQKLAIYWMMLFALIFPIYTVLSQGFLGFGINFLMTILIFVGTFYRPRWQVIAGSAIAIFAAMSLYVVYIEHRGDIRSAVWGGASLDRRIDSVMLMLEDIGPFDMGNPKHLEAIDERLNQNELVGSAIEYVPKFKEYADGATLYDAVLALVPRALWPDKSITAGSGNLVSEYTSIQFAEGTSVGIGQVMEFYVNFGWTGIAVGFFIFGAILRYIDLRLAQCLMREAWDEVGLWFTLGVSLLQPIGQLVELTSSAGGAAVLGLLIQRYIRSQVRQPLPGAKRVVAAVPRPQRLRS